MHTAFRRSITAGVALATVGAIAVVPTAAQPLDANPPERRVVTAEVAPAAFFDPSYAALLADGVAGSLQESLHALTHTSPALLQEALANWPIAETELAYSQIANALVVPLMPLIAGPFTDAVTEVLARSAPQFRDQIETLPTFVEHSTIRMLGPVLGAIGAAGAAHAEIYWATATGDIPGFVLGVLKIPVYVADGFLFGGYGDIGPLLSGSDGRVIPAPGLLTPWNSDLLHPREDAEIAPSAEPEPTVPALAASDDDDVVDVTEDEVDVDVDKTDRGETLKGATRPSTDDPTDEPEDSDTDADDVETETDTDADESEESASDPSPAADDTPATA